ncbi:hypothetical protein WJX81_008149 [Elliptochloris bilobata]|uniref:Uncharacterized protein n=1 Tax=Elliptochloris bilobata TaxID=381761 RepID=A0AAW1SD18_9CHLO
MDNSVQKLKKQLAICRGDLAAALKREEQLQAEVDSLLRARQADAALQCWEPAVIQKAHERVVSQQPVQSEWRLRTLREALRDNKVFRESKARSLRSTNERLDAEDAHLHAYVARYGGAWKSYRPHQRRSADNKDGVRA